MITAQLMAGAPVGGAETFFERLCTALHAAGDTVLPVIRRDAGRLARLRGAGLSPLELGFAGDPLTAWRLRRHLQKTAPAVVVAWMGRAAAAAPTGSWTLVGRLGGYYDLRRFARCRHLVGNTRDIADWMIRQGIPSARVHHLPNFVPDFSGAPAADRAALGVPAAAPMLLALGRLHRAKGFDTLIRALPGLAGAHLVIAGEGPERSALLALAEACGVGSRLHLPGWRGDAAALLAACDLFVCPSRHEPLGNVVLEAWSAARPVLAAAAQGPAAMITQGADGMLVPPENPAALATAAAAMLADRAAARRLAEAGRRRWRAEFAEPAVVRIWQDFLRAVAP